MHSYEISNSSLKQFSIGIKPAVRVHVRAHRMQVLRAWVALVDVGARRGCGRVGWRL